jgi:NADPH:quinone reductase
MNIQTIQVSAVGGPEQLKLVDTKLAAPAAGEIQIRHEAIGVNYIDVYFRTGVYPAPAPFTPGMEGAGVVTAVGEGAGFSVGDRVAYTGRPMGSYATHRNLPASVAVKIPQSVSFEVAASIMLKGLTVEYLLRRTIDVRVGDMILVHAAAGGVGLLMCQWAKHIGATVIGTVGSPEKAALAKQNGCDYPLLYRSDDWVAQVKEITSGKGCRVVYDSVGKDTFLKSMDCVATRGLLALFGASSGAPAPMDPGMLAGKGSIYLTRPTLFNYIALRSEYDAASAALFDVVVSGNVRVHIGARYAMKDSAQAHIDLEARKTSGALLLIP